MKKFLLFVLLSASIFSCKKDKVDPVVAYESIRIFPDYNASNTTEVYKYSLYTTSDSTSFDTSSTPIKTYSGTMQQLWNGTFYESVKIDMVDRSKVYVVGYRTPVNLVDTTISEIRKYLYFTPDTSHWVELPVTRF